MKTLLSPHDNMAYSPTERAMLDRLMESDAVSDDYTLCLLPISAMIDRTGVLATQTEMNRIDAGGKKLFVCDHVLAEQMLLDAQSIVATPYATIGDRFISIPHLTNDVDVSKKKAERSMLFSFFGSVGSNEVRRGLAILYPNNCINSDLLGLDEAAYAERYYETLGDSEFSLCPRNERISSARIFDSMAMGAIPIIIADGYKPPMHTVIDWPSISITVRSGNVGKLGQSILQSFSKEKIASMRKRMGDVYEEYFSPEHLERSITLAL